MSNADTAIAQAHVAAQALMDRKAAKAKANPKPKTDAAPSPRARQFAAAVERNRANSVITLESARRLAPTADRVTKIVQHFAMDDVDYDSLVSTGNTLTLAELNALAPGLVSTVNGEANYRALEMHAQRMVGARVASAHGQASFYETKRQLAAELSSAITNMDRDEDRMGIDGGANRAAFAREFAAQLGVKAYVLMALAEGACEAYAEYFGSEWKPYSKTNARTVSQNAAAAEAEALGI